MKRTAIYLRVSTAIQDYQRQKDELLSYAQRNDLQVCHIFEEKMSGAIDDRPEFQKMLTLRDIDIILVWELSRLGRRMSTVISMVEDMAKRGVCVIALKESFKSLDNNGAMTPSTIMMLSFGSAMAEIERTSIKERTRSGRRQKILSGKMTYTSQPPIGYDLVDGHLVVNSDADKIIKMFEMYKNGSSLNMLASLFGMDRAVVYKILHNEVYCGKKYSKYIEGYVETPAIISVDNFNLVQKMLKDNIKVSKKADNLSPLKGKLFCNICGGMLSKHGGEKYPSWQCRCGKTTLHFKYAELCTEKILDEVKNRLGVEDAKKETQSVIDDLTIKMLGQDAYLDNLYDQIEEVEKKIDVLKEVFTSEQLKSEVAELKRLRTQYEKEKRILAIIIADIKTKEESLNCNQIDESVIKRIDVIKITKTHKILEYNIFGNIYKVEIDYTKTSKVIINIL